MQRHPQAGNHGRRQQHLHHPRPARDRAEVEAKHFLQGISFGNSAVNDHEGQRPEVTDGENARDSSARSRAGPRGRRRWERRSTTKKRSSLGVQSGCGANVTIEKGSQQEQRRQTDEEFPAFHAARFGPPQRADERCGLGLDQRVKPDGTPAQPEEDSSQVQDEINQAHWVVLRIRWEEPCAFSGSSATKIASGASRRVGWRASVRAMDGSRPGN